eukprot:RCo043093
MADEAVAVWHQPLFRSFLLDPYLAPSAGASSENASGGPTPADSAFVAMSQAVASLSGLLSQVTREARIPAESPASVAVQQAHVVLQQYLQLARKIPVARTDRTAFVDFLMYLVAKVSTASLGSCILLPGGWCGGPSVRAHAMLYLLHRVDEQTFTFAVANTGLEEGLRQHHTQRVEVSPPTAAMRLCVGSEERR